MQPTYTQQEKCVVPGVRSYRSNYNYAVASWQLSIALYNNYVAEYQLNLSVADLGGVQGVQLNPPFLIIL